MISVGARTAGTSKHRSSGGLFSFYSTITVDHTKIPSTQTNFPVLVSGTFAYLKTVANGGYVQNASGYDIVFSSDSAGGSRYAFEIESYDPTTGTVNFWVKLPSISSSSDTVFYMAFGSASISTSQESKAALWANGFVSVQHLNGDSTDSTGNGHTGSDTSISYGAELIAEGASFNGSSSGIDLGTSAALGEGSALTVSVWAKYSALPNAYNAVEAKSESGVGGRTLLVKSSGKLAVYIDTTTGTGNKHINYDGSGSNTLSSGVWYYLSYTFDGTTGGNTSLAGYVNGVQDGSASTSGTSTIGPLGVAGAHETFGHAPAFDPRFIGAVMDEARVASVVRTADWLLAEYNNQSNPSTFYSVVSPYLYSKTITIDHTKVPSTQTDFPVLVSTTIADLKTVANGGHVHNGSGYDIIVSSTNNVDGSGKLAFEVESYDATTGAVNIWVKVPSLSSSVDAVIYILYSNLTVTTDQSNKTAVWDSNFVQVNHLVEASGATLKDSTSNSNSSTVNTNSTQVSGPWGKATQFVKASSARAQFPTPFATNTPLTFSCWVKIPSSADYAVVYAALTAGVLGAQLYTDITTGNLTFTRFPGIGHAAGPIADGAWHFAAVSYDTSEMRIFTDGNSAVAALDGTADNTWGNGELGSNNFGGAFYSATNKELRVSKIKRSDDWLKTEYNNQSSPSTFYSVT